MAYTNHSFKCFDLFEYTASVQSKLYLKLLCVALTKLIVKYKKKKIKIKCRKLYNFFLNLSSTNMKIRY